MINVDYISTKDINRVAKIHSNKKYFNWIMKVIDNEYRFYPPLIIENTELDNFDDFDFEDDEDDISNLSDILTEEHKLDDIAIFGELWNNTTKFFKEEKFHFVNILESELDKKRRTIKKGMNTLAKIEKYDVKDIKVCKNSNKKINIEKYVDMCMKTDAYKLYKAKPFKNCLLQKEKYKYDFVDNYKASRNKIYNAKITKFIKKDEIEILSWE